MSTTYTSAWRDHEVAALGELADKFFAKSLVPDRDRWDAQQHVDREVWLEAGKLGLLCCSIPEEYGGGGGSFAHDLAVIEAQARALDSAWGNSVHSGIVAHYILAYGTEEQRRRWLPQMASGEMISAIAMTEPGAGSDLKNIKTTALRDGDEYVINGAKTFISNGSLANLIVVVAKTDPKGGAKGISLIVAETADLHGFTRGRILDKVGQHGADTSELFFESARVPADNVLGGVEGKGFGQLMTQLAQERLTHRGERGRRDGGRGRGDNRLYQVTQCLRPDALRFPEHEVHPGRVPDPGARGPGLPRLVHRASPARRTRRDNGGDGQVVADRTAMPGHRPLPATLRRLRVHARVPHCAHV